MNDFTFTPNSMPWNEFIPGSTFFESSNDLWGSTMHNNPAETSVCACGHTCSRAGPIDMAPQMVAPQAQMLPHMVPPQPVPFHFTSPQASCAGLGQFDGYQQHQHNDHVPPAFNRTSHPQPTIWSIHAELSQVKEMVMSSRPYHKLGEMERYVHKLSIS
jgi:hypothetical protein